MATTNEYRVTGMTCAHCESAVRGEVSQLEGVEQIEECSALVDMGVVLQQGYLFARPQIGEAAIPTFPA